MALDMGSPDLLALPGVVEGAVAAGSAWQDLRIRYRAMVFLLCLLLAPVALAFPDWTDLRIDAELDECSETPETP